MKLKEFRQSGTNIAMVSKLLASSEWKTIREVLDAEHPARLALPFGTSIEECGKWQQRIEGYEKVLNIFDEMLKPEKTRGYPESNYGVDPKEAPKK